MSNETLYPISEERCIGNYKFIFSRKIEKVNDYYSVYGMFNHIMQLTDNVIGQVFERHTKDYKLATYTSQLGDTCYYNGIGLWTDFDEVNISDAIGVIVRPNVQMDLSCTEITPSIDVLFGRVITNIRDDCGTDDHSTSSAIYLETRDQLHQAYRDNPYVFSDKDKVLRLKFDQYKSRKMEEMSAINAARAKLYKLSQGLTD